MGKNAGERREGVEGPKGIKERKKRGKECRYKRNHSP
jgi:hypothetical protein